MDEKIRGYTKEDLMAMSVSELRALLHERTHHTIEVFLYRILKGKMRKPENFGSQAKMLLDIWKERGLPTNTPNLEWCMLNIETAEKLNAGEQVELDSKQPESFSEAEMKTVKIAYRQAAAF